MRIQVNLVNGEHLISRNLPPAQVKAISDHLLQESPHEFFEFPEQNGKVLVVGMNVTYISVYNDTNVPRNRTDIDNPALPGRVDDPDDVGDDPVVINDGEPSPPGTGNPVGEPVDEGDGGTPPRGR